MKFTTNDISVDQLTTIGLTRADIEKLPEITRNTLLSGNRTSLMRFTSIKVDGFETPLILDAKLSLKRLPDGSASLELHPINHVAKNVFGLTPAEEKQLHTETKEFLRKDVMFKNGSMQPVIIALDKTTNEYIAIKENEIKLPERINGQKLSDRQKLDFVEGKEVKVLDNTFRFKPTSERMIEPLKGQLDSIEFKHTRYNSSRLLIDLALIASGLGSVVLLEHLLDLAASSKFNYKVKENLQDKNVRDAVSTAISETVKDNKGKVTPDELTGMLAEKLKENTSLTSNNVDANHLYLKEVGSLINNAIAEAPRDDNALIIHPNEIMEATVVTVEDDHIAKDVYVQAEAEEVIDENENKTQEQNEETGNAKVIKM